MRSLISILTMTVTLLGSSTQAFAVCEDPMNSALQKMPTAEIPTPKCKLFQGRASIYADRLNGRRTASGERYSSTELTAAHKTLPFGTRVVVTNKSNGQDVSVLINDRGPFVRGREIDLSASAAKELGITGVSLVQLEVCGDS